MGGAGAYLAATAWYPIAGLTDMGGQALAGQFGMPGQLALAAGSVGAAEAILNLSGYLSATWNIPELAGARETLSLALRAARAEAQRQASAAQQGAARQQFVDALEEAARRD